MYYSLLFKCLIGVFNYNIFMESNLKQPRLFRVYFGKYRAVWFAVYKYGGTNTVDKKPQWYLPMHALLKEHLIEGSDTAEISYTRLRNQLKSNPKSRNHKRN
jgi:hypothetical protein